MSPTPTTYHIILVLLGVLWWFFHIRCQKNGRKLPPGPRGLPIIGNLHMLGTLPHRTLNDLYKKYGDIMTLHLGSVTTIVVSSPKAAELFLKTHDTVFASRPKLEVGKYLSYGNKGMIFTPYGPYWRNVRKFCTVELLSPAKINSFAGMRKSKLHDFVVSIKEAAMTGQVVDISDRVLGLVEDTTYSMLFGRSEDGRFDLRGTIQQAVDLTGVFNLGDFLPILKPLDLQGLTQRLKENSKAIDEILEMIISDHEQDVNLDNQRPYIDFVDVILSLTESSPHVHDKLSYEIDRSNIKAILLDMIAAAIGSSNNIIEWVMSELLRHPRVMKHLKEELKSIVGVDRMVEEIDLPNLDYLYMVVKESFRLHPIAPLLGPHESMEDIVINGYYIPKNSRVIVNAWALGRDPIVWSENAEEFIPERFIHSNIDLKGQDFQLLPFGSGRRGCPGMHLGLVNVQLIIGQLVHCFNWELPNGMSPSDLSMDEKFGMTMPRSKNLLAIPVVSELVPIVFEKASKV